jgi:hypothetical protein
MIINEQHDQQPSPGKSLIQEVTQLRREVTAMGLAFLKLVDAIQDLHRRLEPPSDGKAA